MTPNSEETVMKIPKDLEKRLTARFGKVINLNKNPEVFQEIFEEIAAAVPKPSTDPRPVTEGSPFGVSWMDSWIAHWAINERIMTAQARNEEFASVLRSLVDLKFKERVNELRRFVREYPHFADGPPDGGPPEPGTPPPAGPSSFTAPDGGPPEPGTPPAGPSSFDVTEIARLKVCRTSEPRRSTTPNSHVESLSDCGITAGKSTTRTAFQRLAS
jgi:hypothetical protein